MAVRQHGANVTQPAACLLWKTPTPSISKDKSKHQIVYMNNLDKFMTSSLALTLLHCTTFQLRVRSRSLKNPRKILDKKSSLHHHNKKLTEVSTFEDMMSITVKAQDPVSFAPHACIAWHWRSRPAASHELLQS